MLPGACQFIYLLCAEKLGSGRAKTPLPLEGGRDVDQWIRKGGLVVTLFVMWVNFKEFVMREGSCRILQDPGNQEISNKT